MEYKAGDMVIYTNGDRKEVGAVKRVKDEQSAFVWYHTGDTAACTNFRDLKPFKSSDYGTISNQYAYAVLKERSKILKNGGVIL